MRALLASGGWGTRLRPFSHSRAKQLFPIANKPVLEYALEDIRGIGVRDIGIVVGDRGADIAEALGDGRRFGVRLTYLHQKKPLGIAHCVTMARGFLGNDDFVMYLGDNIIPGGITEIANDFHQWRPDAQIAVHKVTDPQAFGVAELDADSNVVYLDEKPKHPRSDLALMGVYFFTPAIHESVAHTIPSERGEVEITHAIQRLVDQGFHVRASEHHGFWRDAGTPEAVLDCNRRILDDLRTRNSGTTDSVSHLSGQVVIENGARVLRSVIKGPAIIGEGTLLEDVHVGPYTSVGRKCVLQGTDISNSVIMDEALVCGLSDVRDSVIGRSARLSHSVPGATPHRLLLGDHSRMETV